MGRNILLNWFVKTVLKKLLKVNKYFGIIKLSES